MQSEVTTAATQNIWQVSDDSTPYVRKKMEHFECMHARKINMLKRILCNTLHLNIQKAERREKERIDESNEMCGSENAEQNNIEHVKFVYLGKWAYYKTLA